MFMEPEFAVLADPLIAFMAKGVMLKWEAVYTRLYVRLKIDQSNCTLLQISDPVILSKSKANASGVAVDEGLEQKGKLVGMLSRP